MTEPDSRAGSLSSVLSDMEGDVYDVRRWGDVLIIMSASSHLASPETLSVLGNALHDLGETLREQFKRAMELAHPPA